MIFNAISLYKLLIIFFNKIKRMPSRLPFLSNIDIYGTDFQFTIFQNNKFRTVFGGLSTIVTVGLLLMFSLLFGKDLFYRTNPKVLYQNVFPTTYSSFQMRPDNFVVAYRLSYSNGDSLTPDDMSKIYPVPLYFSYLKNKTTGQLDSVIAEQLPVNRCSTNNSKIKEFNQNYNISDWYCFDWSDTTQNYTFGGGWDGDFLNYFALSYAFCPNGNWVQPDANCSSYSDIKNVLNNGVYVQFLYINDVFAPENLTNPLSIVYQNYFFTLDPLFRKTDRFYFHEVNLKDDQGWFTESINNQSVYSFSNIQSDYFLKQISDYSTPGSPSLLYTSVFYLSKNYDSYSRSFMKIQDFAAIMAGFFKITLVMFSLICNVINYYQRDEYIFNELFEYKHYHSTPQINLGQKINSILKDQSNTQNKSNIDFNYLENPPKVVEVDQQKNSPETNVTNDNTNRQINPIVLDNWNNGVKTKIISFNLKTAANGKKKV